MADVVVAGHVCLDIAPRFNTEQTFGGVFAPGRLSLVGPTHLSTGGAVANTGLAVRKLGLATVLMAKVGADAFGGIIKDILAASGAEVMLSTAPEATTSYTVVLNPPGTDRIFLHHSGANNSFTTQDLQMEEVRRSRLFHLGYPPLMESLYRDGGTELVRLMTRVKELGVTTSLDLAMPDPSTPSGQADWEGILARVAPFVDIFVPSYEELFLMMERKEYLDWRERDDGQDLTGVTEPERVRRFARRLQEWGMGFVMIKAGKSGIYLRTPSRERLEQMGRLKVVEEWADQEYWAEARQPEVFVSSTGAGDCAIAGFLAALLKGASPLEALQTAICAGMQNLRAVDAVSGLGDWEELLQASNKEAEYLEVDLQGTGFKHIHKGVWSLAKS